MIRSFLRNLIAGSLASVMIVCAWYIVILPLIRHHPMAPILVLGVFAACVAIAILLFCTP